MEQSNQSQPTSVPHDSEPFGSVRNGSESSGSVPNHSEGVGTVRKASEALRNIPNPRERKEYCTLTVREVARLFEAAGVARTERSIINWCQANRMGICRLENYFDPNERKYFISPQSVELVIAEEKAKAAKSEVLVDAAESVPKDSEELRKNTHVASEPEPGRLRELEKQVFDLQITNRGKDYLIEQIQKERNGFFDQLLQASRKVGELETKLFQLEAPKDDHAGTA